MKLMCVFFWHKVDRLKIKRAYHAISWMNPYAPIFECQRCGKTIFHTYDDSILRPVLFVWSWLARKIFLMRCNWHILKERIATRLTGKERLPF